MKATKSIQICITAVCAAIFASSCSKTDLPTEDLSRSTIPYSLAVADTKVSYEGGSYAFATGDKINVVGKVRTDIEGELEYNSSNDKWEGDLSYLTAQGAPAAETVLTATIVHAANSDISSYANAIVGSSTANQLQYAVEHYGLFTADFEFGEENAISLTPKASYLDVTVTFTFDGGTPQMTEGVTYVDLKTSSGTVSGPTQLVQDGSNFKAQFLAAVLGGQDASGFEITACDRKITFNSGTTLACNKKYTVNRTIEFKPELGDPYWSNGTYGRFEHSAGVEVVGIIVYVNDYDDNDNSDLAIISRALTEESYGYGRALVMSLRNAASNVKWRNNATQQTYSTTYITSPAQTLVAANLSGYHNSDLLAGCTAVDYALNYRSGDTHLGSDSGWFLPTIGQWIYSISTRGFGGADPVETWIATDKKNWLTNGQLSNLVGVMRSSSSENALVLSLNNRLEVLKQQFGCDYDAFGMSQGTLYGDNYWTSSENEASKAIRMNFGSMETINGQLYSTIKTAALSKSSSNPGGNYSFSIMKVRPFLAF